MAMTPSPRSCVTAVQPRLPCCKPAPPPKLPLVMVLLRRVQFVNRPGPCPWPRPPLRSSCELEPPFSNSLVAQPPTTTTRRNADTKADRTARGRGVTHKQRSGGRSNQDESRRTPPRYRKSGLNEAGDFARGHLASVQSAAATRRAPAGARGHPAAHEQRATRRVPGRVPAGCARGASSRPGRRPRPGRRAPPRGSRPLRWLPRA